MTTTVFSSPHLKQKKSVTGIMLRVWLASLPGFVVMIWQFGWAHLVQALIAISSALIIEGLVLRLRRYPVRPILSDGSAFLTAWLLVLALPPLLPWWMTVIAVFAAIVFAKQLFGGLGQNPFNPAMVAYALLLVSFPLQMTTAWPDPNQWISISDALSLIFGSPESIDAFTAATPLDIYKTYMSSLTQAEIMALPAFDGRIAPGWLWVNVAYLVGGIYLVLSRVITWHIPVAFLAALTLMALIFAQDADLSIPLSLHLLGGATMLGAFFIATDPTTAASSNLGKLVFAAGIGILLFTIRQWGNYPDAVAFSVLLMNFSAPLIDQYIRPRTYGKRGRKA